MSDAEGDDASSAAGAARDYEAEAGKSGWKPKDEWEGDPSKWKDAKSWVEYGELRDSIRKDYDARFAKLEKATSKTIATMERAHKAEIDGLRAQRREAVKAGDVDEVERLDEEIDKRRDAAPLNDDPEDQVRKAEEAFAKENPWYGTNAKMTKFAQEHSQALAKARPNLSMEENIKLVLEAVQEEFPEKFKKTGANAHAPVDGGSDAPSGSRKTSKGWSDLPSEAKRAYEGYDKRVKERLSKDEFAKQYFEDA